MAAGLAARRGLLSRRLLRRSRVVGLARCAASAPASAPPPPEAGAAAAGGGDSGAAAAAHAPWLERGFAPDSAAAAAALGLQHPTEIQQQALDAVREGSDVLLASHTGSGKTLAYLLPVVEALREEEADSGRRSRTRRPRALVVGPTRELAEQVLGVCKAVSHHSRFSSTGAVGGGPWRTQNSAFERGVDVVVGTPGRIVKHIDAGNLVMTDLRFLVLDEADTLFQDGFDAEVKRLLRPIHRARQAGKPAQALLVSATVTKAVERLLREELPDVQRVATRSLHRGVPTARHRFMDVPGTVDRLSVLEQVVAGEARRGARIVVFCGTVSSCRAVDHALREAGVDTANYHGEMPHDARAESMAAFAAAPDPDDEFASPPVLVCTDVAARGLDFKCAVDHVVNFDFPSTAVDYIHRAGRTARAGASGKITSLVAKRDKALATQLNEQLNSDGELDALDRAGRKQQTTRAAPGAAATQRKRARARKELEGEGGGRGRRGSSRRLVTSGQGARRASTANLRTGGAKRR